jgi:serine protease Do
MRILCALLVAAALGASASAQSALPDAFSKPVPTSIADLKAIEQHVQKLVARTMPATVCLRVGSAQGSGVIIDKEGHILTAGHVSGGADRDAVIILADGRRLKGRTLGSNIGIDSGMALITEKADFPFVEMAKSADLKKGDWCLSLGHPGGYKANRPPVVRLGRLQQVTQKILESDCSLVGGDSGGPLFDMHGRVIGIHSRIGGRVSSNVHVPIDTYKETWTKLTAGEVWGNPLAFLDVLRPGEAYLGMRVALDKKTLKVESVTPGSPADKAGFKSGDLVLKVDNQTLDTPQAFGDLMKSRRPGAKLVIQIQRSDNPMTITVVLGKRAE